MTGGVFLMTGRSGGLGVVEAVADFETSCAQALCRIVDGPWDLMLLAIEHARTCGASLVDDFELRNFYAEAV